MSGIGHLVEQLMQNFDPDDPKKISKTEYEQWARAFIFQGLRNQRYGQSFCNHFNITDNLLYFSASVKEADHYIQKNYLL